MVLIETFIGFFAMQSTNTKRHYWILAWRNSTVNHLRAQAFGTGTFNSLDVSIRRTSSRAGDFPGFAKAFD